MATQWNVSMRQNADGSFKLGEVQPSGEFLGADAVLRAEQEREPEPAPEGDEDEEAVPGRSVTEHLMWLLFGVLCAVALSLLLVYARAVNVELRELRSQLASSPVKEMVQVRSDMTALRNVLKTLAEAAAAEGAADGSVAATLKEGAREALQNLSAASAAASEVEEDAENYSTQEMGMDVLALGAVVLLVAPTVCLFMYEYKLGAAKQDESQVPPAAGEATRFMWRDQIAYRIDFYLSTYPSAKTVFLLMVTAILIAFGALLYHPFADHDDGLAESLWMVWLFVADPGTHADQGAKMSRTMAFMATIGGMLVFALMIGIVSDTISDRMDDLNKGLSRVMETDHTLILGWSDKLLPAIVELANANESEGGGQIVVLAERDKDEMEIEVRERCPNLRGTRVICRSGTGIRGEDLKRCSAENAKAIIMLADDAADSADESDAKVLRMMLSLMGMPEFVRSEAHAVAELRDLDNRELILLVGKKKVETVVAHDTVGRLMIQCARQPGLGAVMESLLGFEGCEFYMKNWPELTGATFGDVSLRFAAAVPVGIKSAVTGLLRLNPPNDTVLAEDDELVVLAEDDDTYSPSTEAFPYSKNRSPSTADAPEHPECLLFCGWRRDMQYMVGALDSMVAPGSRLTILADLEADEQRKRLVDANLDPDNAENLSMSFVEGSHVCRKDLEKLVLQDFDSVLILADEVTENDMETTDSESLACLLRIQDIVQARKKESMKRGAGAAHFRQPELISEILDSRTKELLALTQVSEYVMSNELISAALAMVSENRHVNGVLQELLSADGNETYVRGCDLYTHKGEKTSFFTIMKRARLRGEVAIGYISGSAAVTNIAEQRSRVIINPTSKEEQRVWDVGKDMIVVFADD